MRHYRKNFLRDHIRKRCRVCHFSKIWFARKGYFSLKAIRRRYKKGNNYLCDQHEKSSFSFKRYEESTQQELSLIKHSKAHGRKFK